MFEILQLWVNIFFLQTRIDEQNKTSTNTLDTDTFVRCCILGTLRADMVSIRPVSEYFVTKIITCGHVHVECCHDFNGRVADRHYSFDLHNQLKACDFRNDKALMEKKSASSVKQEVVILTIITKKCLIASQRYKIYNYLFDCSAFFDWLIMR